MQSSNKKPHNDGQSHPGTQQEPRLNGLKIDTCANQTTVISVREYRTYCKTFHLLQSVRLTTNQSISGSGGESKAVGALVVQVPFKKLKIVIDMSFIVLKKEVPTLLFIKFMMENGLGIFVQGHYVNLGSWHHPLRMEDYILIYR